jgi:hypothetical protein
MWQAFVFGESTMASKAAAMPPIMPRTVTKTSVSAVSAQRHPNQHPPAHPHQEQHHPCERFRRPTSHLEALDLRVVNVKQQNSNSNNPDNGGEGAMNTTTSIVQPWDAGFHQAARDLNRRVIQQLLDGIDAQEAKIKNNKAASGDADTVEEDGDGEGEGIVGDDNDNDEDKMAPKDDEPTDADADTAIDIIEKVGRDDDSDDDDGDANASTKELMQQLQTQRDILSSLRIPTAETLSVMERCFASFLHVFCPPPSSEVAKELMKQQMIVTNNHASS